MSAETAAAYRTLTSAQQGHFHSLMYSVRQRLRDERRKPMAKDQEDNAKMYVMSCMKGGISVSVNEVVRRFGGVADIDTPKHSDDPAQSNLFQEK